MGVYSYDAAITSFVNGYLTHIDIISFLFLKYKNIKNTPENLTRDRIMCYIIL